MWKLKRRFTSVARGVANMVATNTDVERGPVHRPGETSPLLNGNQRQDSGVVHESSEESGAHGFLALCKLVAFSNYVNVLLVFVPLGIISGALGWGAIATFVLNFLAIIPLAALLSFATEELALKVGETLGGLLNATFGNAVELIVSIVALTKGQITIVQASMLGSILSNLLLVLGMCFLFGGMRYEEQEFNSTVASTMSSLMAVSSSSLIIPAALYSTLHDSKDPNKNELIWTLSKGTAVVLLVLYVLYLYFQLKSHANLFQDAEEVAEPTGLHLGIFGSGVVLVLITVLVAVCAEYLVGSIEGIVESSGISPTFIGLILIPIVGNAAEHTTAVVVAMKNKMDLAIGVAIGSSMQIALMVTPFLVILGWIMNVEPHMTLQFGTFETITLFVSTNLIFYLVQDGKSNYLEGAMLLGIYIIIAISFFVLPESASKISGPS